jgi:hypothetical protein
MRNPTQAALYARVSSEQQAEAHTIASQGAALQERVAADGLTVAAAMQFLDEGYSGAPWAARPWSVCAMSSPRAAWIGSTSTRRIVWPANTPTKCCSLMSFAAPGSRWYF